MQVLTAPTLASLPWTASTANPGAAPAPQDKVDLGSQEPTPLARALAKLNPYAAGAVIGVGTLTPPLLGGMVGGIPGALVGGAAAFGFQYAVDRNARRSLGAALWPTLMGALMAGSTAAPTPLRVGMVVGLGAAMGVLAVWRGKIEADLNRASAS